MSSEKVDALEATEELFNFLQGHVPEGYEIDPSHVPTLTAAQAWTAVWFIQNKYYEFPDAVDRCDVCGELYDSRCGGDCLDYGDAPYHFCDSCTQSGTWWEKAKLNPDKSLRPFEDA